MWFLLKTNIKTSSFILGQNGSFVGIYFTLLLSENFQLQGGLCVRGARVTVHRNTRNRGGSDDNIMTIVHFLFPTISRLCPDKTKMFSNLTESFLFLIRWHRIRKTWLYGGSLVFHWRSVAQKNVTASGYLSYPDAQGTLWHLWSAC